MISDDAYLGTVIGLIIAVKKLLDAQDVNAECVLGNCLMLYLLLGWRIGYHWLKFFALIFFTVFTYMVCLRPSELISSNNNVVTSLCGLFKQKASMIAAFKK